MHIWRRALSATSITIGWFCIRKTGALLQAGIAYTPSWSMSTSRANGDDRVPIILGSKSSTRRMILEEMEFSPIIRY